MRRLLIVISLSFLVLTVVVLTVSCKNEQSENIEVVTPEEMQEISELEDVQLIDIRTPQEFDEGHIASSQNIDYFSETFEEDIQKLDKTKPVVVYCKSGKKSSECADKMKDKGFVKIYELDGGIAKWKYKGFDLEMIP